MSSAAALPSATQSDADGGFEERLKQLRRHYVGIDITAQLWFTSRTRETFGGTADIYIGRRVESLRCAARCIASIMTVGFVTCEAAEKVAVKILRIDRRMTDMNILENNIGRFVREISIWRKLEHPNIQPMCGVWWPQRELAPSMVSRWMEKGNLSRHVAKLLKSKDLSEHQLRMTQLNLLQDILGGLMYLHDNGVVHADLKSDNVLISPDDKPVLCDFGLAWTCIRTSISFRIGDPNGGGSVEYMAPELVDEGVDYMGNLQQYTPNSDIWAFGCLSCLVLTGLAPYNNKSHMQYVVSALLKKVFFPRPAGIDNPHWAVILTCCSFDVCERPSTAFLCDHLRILRLLLRHDLPPLAQAACDDYRNTLKDSTERAETICAAANASPDPDASAAARRVIVDALQEATERLTNRLRLEEDVLGLLYYLLEC